MDPNPKIFPILSYVMSRVPQPGADSEWDQIDLEQPSSLFQPQPQPHPSEPSSSSSSSSAQPPNLADRMPHLAHPEVIQSMTVAISQVAQTRSVIQSLGSRPDHESVDVARARLTEIESNLLNKLEQMALDRKPEDVDTVKWIAVVEEKERECRKEAEKEKEAYKAVVRLEEMHEAYERMLKEAEEKLVVIYEKALRKERGEEVLEEEQVNEEIVGILLKQQEAKRVELSGRNFTIFPELVFRKLHALLALNLSNNQFQMIPDAIAGLEILEELNLSNNLLESLPDSIGLLLNLKFLDVSSNKLKVLPDSISHCRSLVEVDASFNHLSYLPTNIGYELVNLRKLSIHLNKIRSLPTSICEMSSLRILDAHFNEIRVLPQAIGRLTNLEILNLSSNFSDLKELPDTLGDLANLRELNLANNQIHALPNTFGRLDNLSKLNLEQNPIVIPPLEIVNEGVEAVKEFMAKRWVDILAEEEERSRLEVENQAQIGWLTRSRSTLTNWASAVSESVTGYLGVKSPNDPYLDQQL